MSQEKTLIYQADGIVSPVTSNFTVAKVLKPNFYHIKHTNMGFGTKRDLQVDDSITLPNSAIESYRQHFTNVGYINKYFSEDSRIIHKSLNVKHKLGILLYGKQGTGKTTICYSLAQYLIDSMDAIAITVESVSDLGFALAFAREVDPKDNVLKVLIMDECEQAMYNHESQMKRILDSTSSVDNVLFLFTTNYIDQVPEAIKDRPSRIKWCKEIGGYGDAEEIYRVMDELNNNLEESIKLTGNQISGLVEALINKTIDEIKNTFIDKVLNVNLTKIGAIESLINKD